MSRNGSGVYSLPAGNPVVTLTAISTSWANSTLTDIANELTNSIDKGGRTVPTANLPMGSTFKHTGAAAASAAGEYLVYGQTPAAQLGGDLAMLGNLAVGTATPLVTAAEGQTIYLYNAANTGTVASNATLRVRSVNRNANVQLSGAAAFEAGVQFLSPADLFVGGMTYNYASGDIFWRTTPGGVSTEMLRLTQAGTLQPGTTLTQNLGNTALEWSAVLSAQLQRFSAGTLTINASNAAGVIALRTNGSDKLTVAADGRVYGSALHNNAGAVTGTTNQYIASGTYTPTLTNGANVAASTPRQAQWLRVGNAVTVSGQCNIDPTAGSTVTTLGISLPIASALSTGFQLSGTATSTQTSPGIPGTITGDAANDRASLNFFSVGGADDAWQYQFTYEVL